VRTVYTIYTKLLEELCAGPVFVVAFYRKVHETHTYNSHRWDHEIRDWCPGWSIEEINTHINCHDQNMLKVK